MEKWQQKGSRPDPSDLSEINRPTRQQEEGGSRRKPTPSTGEWPRQPAPARQQPKKSTPVYKETPPPRENTLTVPEPATIIRQQLAIINAEDEEMCIFLPGSLDVSTNCCQRSPKNALKVCRSTRLSK